MNALDTELRRLDCQLNRLRLEHGENKLHRRKNHSPDAVLWRCSVAEFCAWILAAKRKVKN